MAGRRSNGEGSIRRRADGRFEARIMQGYDAKGKRKYLSFYGKTKKEVMEKLNAYRKDVWLGLDITHKYTFAEWSQIWFDSHCDKVTPSTRSNYFYVLKRLKKYLDDRNIADVKPIDIEAVLRGLANEGLSDSYIAQARGMLYMIFEKAVGNDLARKNPVRYAEKRRANTPKKRKEAFTAEEVNALMQGLPHNKIGWTIRIMLGTGLRTQEVLALEPHHITEDGAWIYISQAVKMNRGTVYVGSPKSIDSCRVVPVPDNLRPYAMELRKVTTKYIWEVGKVNSPCNPSHFRDEFRKAISQVEGVRLLTPHSTRHTFVSQAQALGVDLATIQSIVGHADLDMTQHYLHVQEDVRLGVAKKFSDAFPVEDNNGED